MEIEIWKDIEGFEGFYQASSLGRIKSLHRHVVSNWKGGLTVKEKFLKFGVSKGYYNVNIYNNEFKKTKTVHRIIAETFLERVSGKDYVNHKDGDKFNNKASNLEWCTQKENIKHSREPGLKVDRFGAEHHLSKKVGQYKDELLVEEFPSARIASAFFKRNNKCVAKAIKRGTKIMGFKFKYL